MSTTKGGNPVSITRTAIDLESLVLLKGSHQSIEEGVCIMEAVAWIAGEPFSDHPQCASKVISAFMRSWNDAMNDVDRQMLKPYIPRMIGTAASQAIERRRAYLAADWCSRVAVPRIFRQAGWIEEAERLEQLLEVIDKDTAAAASTQLRKARDFAYAERSEQRAAFKARLEEKLKAAGAAWAAWDAGAAGDAGAALAEKIAVAIKGKTSKDAYEITYKLVYDELRPRYEELLRPTVVELQKSALGLLDRMIACGQEVAAT